MSHTLIDEDTIASLAPSPAALKNGRLLSETGKFSNHCQSTDGTLYWAECAGSGKSTYQTSADFADPAKPICRCSCPSRQFPCKHSLGLLYEIAIGKNFAIADIPLNLQEKRRKLQQKNENKKIAATKPKVTNTSAQKKKIAKQLEGLALAETVIDELLNSGLTTLGGSSLDSYQKLAKNFSSCYLPGIQTAFLRMALAVEHLQSNPQEADKQYNFVLQTLITLHSTIKKSKVLLQKQLDGQESTPEEAILFEALGGVWRSEDLRNLGLVRRNVKLAQLSFDVSLDEAKQEYIERAFWIDIDNGTIYHTLNLRPVRALKYVKASDSCFSLLEVAELLIYPGGLDRRVRWDECAKYPLEDKIKLHLPTLAEENIAVAVKKAKGQFKNTLFPKYLPILLPIAQIAYNEDTPILVDPIGNRIVVRHSQLDGKKYDTIASLKHFPLPIDSGCAAFGLLFYDNSDYSICFDPYSIIANGQIVRLMF